MNSKIRIAVDAMGGDNAPYKVLEGINLFLKENKSSFFHLYGNEQIINKLIPNFENLNNTNYKIVHCKDIIPNTSTVRESIKIGKNSSMWKAIESVSLNQNDIVVSSGNTGALLLISKLILKTLDKIDKPALAAIWPNHIGQSIVLDLGANVDCSDKNLIQFCNLGSELYKVIYKKELPNVGILNIGSEEIKGHESIKNANSYLISNKNPFNYLGFIEGNEIKDGKIDVIVSDGFTGNIALKTAEGTANFITTEIKNSFKKNILNKLMYMFVYFIFKNVKKKLDPRKYNGAILLGLNAPVVKSHGGADGFAFYNSIKLSYSILDGNLLGRIKDNFANDK